MLFHGIVPKIEFSKKISKRKPQEDADYTYHVKIANYGNRDILSVECIARLIVDWEGTKNWKAFYIPLNPSGDRKTELPKIPKGGVRVLRLYVSQIKNIRTSYLVPADIKLAAENGTLGLEDVLRLGVTAKFKIYIAGNHGFSGARKVFESGYYTLNDIAYGKFKDLEVVPSAPFEQETVTGLRNNEPEMDADLGLDQKSS